MIGIRKGRRRHEGRRDRGRGCKEGAFVQSLQEIPVTSVVAAIRANECYAYVRTENSLPSVSERYMNGACIEFPGQVEVMEPEFGTMLCNL